MEDQMCIFTLLLSNLSKNRHFKLPVYLKKFGTLKTNLDRMNFVYKDLVKYDALPPFKKDEKSDALAVKRREDGNVFFKSGSYREALDCYTSSVAAAKSKNILALAYANRSAALSKLGLFKECLIDIERALENGYPDDLKPKLVLRRKLCEAEKIVESKYYEPVPKFADCEKNKSIQSARNCVEIAKNEQYGRYVVATRSIEIGEILAVEKPFSAVIKEEIYVHCHHCFELCYNLIACSDCSRALYCSTSCKDAAFNKYHQYECPVLASLDGILVDPPKRLALKTALMVKNELGTDGNEMYCSDRFREICDFLTHVEHRGADNLLARTAVAAGLYHLIKNNTTFLDGVDEDRFKEVFLLLILICGINTVDVNELRPGLMGVYDLGPVAVGLYTFFTIFNHSCWPNVITQHHGSTIVLRVINTVKKGEQCFVSYGPRYLSYSLEFRQTFFPTHQFFTCTCRACVEKWPTRAMQKQAARLDAEDASVSMMQLVQANVNTAKKALGRILKKARKQEKTLPPGCDHEIKEELKFCYNIFGNKSRL